MFAIIQVCEIYYKIILKDVFFTMPINGDSKKPSHNRKVHSIAWSEALFLGRDCADSTTDGYNDPCDSDY
jgi:hypothetical protein